jgi:hypothetical protein
MSSKIKLSDEKLIRIKLEKLRSKSQLEIKRAREYNISFTPDQRALRLKKLRAAKKAKEEEIRKKELRKSKQKEKINKSFSNLNENYQIKEDSIERYSTRRRRFSTEIADRIVLLTNRFKLLL